MKVKDLIAALERQNADAEVYYAYPAGDYWDTTIAGPMDAVLVDTIQHSDYHNAMVVVNPHTADEDDAPIVKAVVLSF